MTQPSKDRHYATLRASYKSWPKNSVWRVGRCTSGRTTASNSRRSGKSREPGAAKDERDYQIRELTLKVAGLEGELGRAELEKRFFVNALRRIEASEHRSGRLAQRI